MKPEDIASIISDTAKQYENELKGETEMEFVEPIHVINPQNTTTYFEILLKRYKLIKDEIKKLILKIFKHKDVAKNHIRKDATVKPVTDQGVPDGYMQMVD